MIKELITLADILDRKGFAAEANALDKLIKKAIDPHSFIKIAARRVQQPDGSFGERRENKPLSYNPPTEEEADKNRLFELENQSDEDRFFLDNPSWIPDDKTGTNFKKEYLSEQKNYVIKATNDVGSVGDLQLTPDVREALISSFEKEGFDFIPPYTYKEVYAIISILMRSDNVSVPGIGIDDDFQKEIGKALMTIPVEEWAGASNFSKLKVVEADLMSRLFGLPVDSEESYMLIDLATGETTFPKGEDTFRREDDGGRREVNVYNDPSTTEAPSYRQTYEINRMNESGRNKTLEQKRIIEKLRDQITEERRVKEDEGYKRYMESEYPPEDDRGFSDLEIPSGSNIDRYSSNK